MVAKPETQVFDDLLEQTQLCTFLRESRERRKCLQRRSDSSHTSRRVGS